MDPLSSDILRRAGAVCFDVDSTLIQEEGVDNLARYCGQSKGVEEWTKLAMSGEVTFRESLRGSLEIIRPTRQQIRNFSDLRPPTELLTPGAEEVIKLLQSRGTVVYLVSGGFRLLIHPVAEYLDIPVQNVYANSILFSEKGEYSGFDDSELTSQTGGKKRVVEKLKREHDVVVIIGDGATDMEAYPPADLFIGFGGNMERAFVKEHAPCYIYSFKELTKVLNEKHKISI